MPIEIAALATTVVTSFLMPYVKEGIKKIAEQVTSQVSEKAASHVTDLTGRVWRKVTGMFKSEKEKERVAEFEADPETWQKPLEKMLLQKLEEDSVFAKELADLINEESPDGAGTGVQIMNASGIIGVVDARGAHIGGSNQTIAGVIVDKLPSPSPLPPSTPSKDG